MRIKLVSTDLSLELDPAAGGSVSALKHKDLDILRPGPPRCGPAFDPLQYAAFPMVPFVGRIHNGQFNANGSQIQLPANLPPEPHAIHGHGWQSAWKVSEQSVEAVSLIYRHEADAWPWPYEATQTFRLSDRILRVDLAVTNLGRTDMPAGLGWHPYFYRKDAVLTVPTTHEWAPDDETGANTPQRIQKDRDLSPGRAVEHLKLDTAFSLASSNMQVEWPTHKIELRADPVFSHATIFVPPGEDFFCAEPISHAPNAVNSALEDDASGRFWLEPQKTLSGRVTLEIFR